MFKQTNTYKSTITLLSSHFNHRHMHTHSSILYVVFISTLLSSTLRLVLLFKVKLRYSVVAGSRVMFYLEISVCQSSLLWYHSPCYIQTRRHRCCSAFKDGRFLSALFVWDAPETCLIITWDKDLVTSQAIIILDLKKKKKHSEDERAKSPIWKMHFRTTQLVFFQNAICSQCPK